MENAKIRVKVGSLELEYEGDQAFVQSGLLSLCDDVIGLSQQIPALPIMTNSGDVLNGTDGNGRGEGNLTISTIAAHLRPDGAQDLVMCALAKIQLIDRKPKADRSEIAAEMKNATAYFKAAMTKNLGRDLHRMVKGKKINEVSSSVYSLTAASREELETKLAGIG